MYWSDILAWILFLQKKNLIQNSILRTTGTLYGASLVKTMEELGIGRPSTYAPTISLILGRRYITKEGKNLYLTEIGEVVNNIMKQSFPSIVDVHFTANMEGLLDMVEEGKFRGRK